MSIESTQHPEPNTIDWFRHAAPYIRAHRNKIMVLAFEGNTIQADNFDLLVKDIILLAGLGVQLVLVHGTRAQTEALLADKQHPSQYHKGQRITDAVALSAAKRACGELRVDLEAKLSANIRYTPVKTESLRVASGNFIGAQPMGVIDGIDHGFTGKVRKVDSAAIKEQLSTGNVVVLSPLGYAPTGDVFNLHSEDVAVAAAAALNADKLIFLTEEAPLSDYNEQRIDQLTTQEATQLLASNTVDEHTARYLTAAERACQQGVPRVHIISRQNPDSLLEELYTRDGTGCLITDETYECIRTATVDDISAMLDLLRPLEQAGVLVMRSREQLELDIHLFSVMERDGKIIGCVALYPFEHERMGELACLVVSPEYAQSGRGEALLKHVRQQAIRMELDTLFVLSTQTGQWFATHGFEPAKPSDLPEVKQAQYNTLRNSVVLTQALTAA